MGGNMVQNVADANLDAMVWQMLDDGDVDQGGQLFDFFDGMQVDNGGGNNGNDVEDGEEFNGDEAVQVI